MTSRLAAGRAGAAGLTATALSIAATFTVAVLGPSVMEPALPGRPGQPPWSVTALPSPYLVVALTAFAIAAGTAGLALTLLAIRRGWWVSPWIILVAGIAAAAALALVPPFGTSDHLSYAAYGRMVVTGHNPYTTTPAALAALGDPVARAVQDWRTSPSVYGSLATGGQAFASLIGGTSVRLTVFVLSLLNVAAFAATGLLLHRMARGDRHRQLRAALLWTGNPLLLQVLISGAHVDSQAIVCAVGALAVFSLGTGPGPAWAWGAGPGSGRASARRELSAAAGAGALIGLGFAVKATTALAGIGLVIGCLLTWRARRQAAPGFGWQRPALVLGGLAAGFGVTAGASLAYWGTGALEPALHEGSFVSIGSPWRAVRAALGLATGQGPAEDAVKAAAVVLALALLALLLRSIMTAAPGAWPQVSGLADGGAARPPAGTGSAGGADRPRGPTWLTAQQREPARSRRLLRRGLRLAGGLAVRAAVVRRPRLGAARAAALLAAGLAAARADGGAGRRLPAWPHRGHAGRPGLAPDGGQGRHHAGDPAGCHRGVGGDAVAAAQRAGDPPRHRQPGW